MASWKQLYRDTWTDGSRRVQNVITALNGKLRRCKVWPTSQYSLSTSIIQDRADHERHEPDLEARAAGKVLCFIEVSGSNCNLREEDIFVLKSKFDAAEFRYAEKKLQTFFVLAYLDQTVVLSIAILRRYRENVRVMSFRGDTRENYVCVPQREGLGLSLLASVLDQAASY